MRPIKQEMVKQNNFSVGDGSRIPIGQESQSSFSRELFRVENTGFHLQIEHGMREVLLRYPNYSLPKHVMDCALQLGKVQDVMLHGVFANSLTSMNRKTYPFPNEIDMLDTDFTKQINEEESCGLEASLVKVLEDYCTSAGVQVKFWKINERHLDALTDSIELVDLTVLSEGTEADMFSLKHFLTSARCPVVLFLPGYQKFEKTIFAYDDQHPGMHSFKMFSYVLPAFRHLTTVSVSVVPSNVVDIEYQEEVTSWFQHHNPQAGLEIIHFIVNETLPQFIDRYSAAFVVMGAYGRSSLSLLFKKSMATVVMNQTPPTDFIVDN